MTVKTDTVAYTRNEPWRGSGVAVEKNATPAQMLKTAGLNWVVEKEPLVRRDGTPIPNYYELRRSDNHSTLDIVKGRYIPTQQTHAFEFFKEFLDSDKHGAHMEYVGSFMGGRIVWGLANLNRSFSVGKNDSVRGYLFLAVPHIRGKSVIARITTVRDACNNTMAIAMRAQSALGNTFRMNHRNEFVGVQQERARTVLGLAREDVAEFGNAAAKLHKAKITPDQARGIFASTFQPNWDGDEKTLSPRVRRLMYCYENAPGAQPGTKWGVLNAATYYCDHVAGRDEGRMANATIGRTSRQKQDVLAQLM